ncbi:uncharacterized protein CMU_022970 [Cryptosporidium muris RN66]|uniref:Leucine rich repeat family protein n=1 Tax=Cryptosporidium muris (strain RN66) TaxID=441375 RepID=B6ABT9_CRYMR|nr:uncharacterized protein CMU_022970 [Cryptosporidium muris RN66]EEA05292.1 hypothetical protein, conserved [Cryptosporidium muris RN66]|eukprot:XP_002139641.1 hypothetical protein [Cryptosporidium muris RN66]
MNSTHFKFAIIKSGEFFIKKYFIEDFYQNGLYLNLFQKFGVNQVLKVKNFKNLFLRILNSEDYSNLELSEENFIKEINNILNDPNRNIFKKKEILSFCNKRIRDDDLKNIPVYKDILKLELKCNGIRNVSRIASNFPNLKYLDISYNLIGNINEIWQLIESIPSLNYILIKGNPIDLIIHKNNNLINFLGVEYFNNDSLGNKINNNEIISMKNKDNNNETNVHLNNPEKTTSATNLRKICNGSHLSEPSKLVEISENIFSQEVDQKNYIYKDELDSIESVNNILQELQPDTLMSCIFDSFTTFLQNIDSLTISEDTETINNLLSSISKFCETRYNGNNTQQVSILTDCMNNMLNLFIELLQEREIIVQLREKEKHLVNVNKKLENNIKILEDTVKIKDDQIKNLGKYIEVLSTSETSIKPITSYGMVLKEKLNSDLK